MLVFGGESLEKYKKNELNISAEWNTRDFVSCVSSYLNSKVENIMAVSGLRGTGKTVGMLQAAESLNALYVLTEEDEPETGKDYVELLKNTDKQYILFDEYSWIKDRDALDRYLLTAVQNGKRIVITGTESISLELLNHGALMHRVHILHTTMFTYEEYLRLYNKTHSKAVCTEFLMEGGLFKDYALRNYDTTKRYIEEAIVKNLSGYLKDEMNEEKARTLTYAVLFKAICPSNLSSIPTLRVAKVTLNNFLQSMGINTSLIPDERDINRVANIFEQIGVIVRIPNIDENSALREQYYITNPSLTCQLILAAYGLRNIENYILGHVFESCVAIQLATNRLEEHKIYFYNSGSIQNNPNNKELDLILTDPERKFAYFFECKFSQSDSVHQDITLLSGELEKGIFEATDIEGRYIIYNGAPSVKDYPVGKVIFAPIGRILDYYFEFDDNVKDIENASAKDNRDDSSNSPDTDSVTKTIEDFVTSAAEKVKSLKTKIPEIIAEERKRIQKSLEKVLKRKFGVPGDR